MGIASSGRRDSGTTTGSLGSGSRGKKYTARNVDSKVGSDSDQIWRAAAVRNMKPHRFTNEISGNSQGGNHWRTAAESKRSRNGDLRSFGIFTATEERRKH